ncbi:TonB family protein [Pedobacter punctiformis]|uniref:TonB family protein n=1 Tax=Pedobacter punctiformis TaxID=3004097 RepID=A0ABT4LD87_9SPHI|nr:TonB family protein [Pedobacter sp. HCMS5-2]MCZ4245886.1 TonB family protein [Pedobacter sp. HCMS5-2]
MSFAHYLLQVNLYLIVFYSCYKLLLDKETYFTLNRIYLVAAGILSLCIPFIRLEWLTEQKAAQSVYATVKWDAVLQQATNVTENKTGINWGNLLVYIYCAGIVFFLGRLVYNLFTVKKLLKTAKAGSAFSFFSQKVIDTELPETAIIDIHEEAHIKQWHTADILFFEILGIIAWINPVIYLYKKAIKNIHEFLADELAAEFQGDKAEYAMLILSKSFGISPNALANGFFDKSLIKKRIYMLHKEPSKKAAILKYGIFIPLFAIFIVFSSATIRKNKQLISITDQIPMEKPIEMVQEIVSQPLAGSSVVLAEHVKNAPAPLSVSAKNLKHSKNLTEPILIETPPKNEEKDNKIYDFVSIDKQPTFPGGITKFYEYLSKSIKYPKAAQENNVSGKVFLSFIVETDGSLSDVAITRGLGSGTDEEALRVIGGSPKWNPGYTGGKPVRVKFNINVNFSLTNSIESKKSKSESAFKVPNLLYKTDKVTIGPSDYKGIVVLDGEVQTDNSVLNSINPQNIASISVLKDQSAVSIYGSKARDGAIVITSKATMGNFLFRKLETVEPIGR